ncbi:hypothetical protein GCM10020366_04710 [Saccharopolyspora gregorii]|uniref:Uncharacterized protein n=1 Tax=Saccharopolyspora gregorii TaxID=33914 RepID=A0ABP6RJ69_9PSEU
MGIRFGRRGPAAGGLERRGAPGGAVGGGALVGAAHYAAPALLAGLRNAPAARVFAPDRLAPGRLPGHAETVSNLAEAAEASFASCSIDM